MNMVNTNPTISINSLNIQALNTQLKVRDCQRISKHTTRLYVVYKKATLNIGRKYFKSKCMEKNTPY